jgi:hypothetical protein
MSLGFGQDADTFQVTSSSGIAPNAYFVEAQKSPLRACMSVAADR